MKKPGTKQAPRARDIVLGELSRVRGGIGTMPMPEVRRRRRREY